MIIAQITDMHIRQAGALAYRRVETAGYLARAVKHLLAMSPRPDVVLATGGSRSTGSCARCWALCPCLCISFQARRHIADHP
jgi:hypothetical protein